MAKQTATEWLCMQLLDLDNHKIWVSLLERAKNMEREQIEKSFDIGFDRGDECGKNYDWHQGQNRGSEYYEQEFLGKERINPENY